jgi:hypothetical protein
MMSQHPRRYLVYRAVYAGNPRRYLRYAVTRGLSRMRVYASNRLQQGFATSHGLLVRGNPRNGVTQVTARVSRVNMPVTHVTTPFFLLRRKGVEEMRRGSTCSR